MTAFLKKKKVENFDVLSAPETLKKVDEAKSAKKTKVNRPKMGDITNTIGAGVL